MDSKAIRLSRMEFSAVRMTELIQRVYGSLLEALLEAVQNAIDAGVHTHQSGKNRILITIDLYGTGKNAQERASSRYFMVQDNGCGMSLDRFGEVMLHIGDSEKEADENSLGRFGLGLLAGHGKGEEYLITTAPKEGKGNPTTWEGYHCHDLSRLELKGSTLYVPADDVVLSEIPWWNTSVLLRGFSLPINSLANLDVIVEQIYTRFNVRMLQFGTEITLKFKSAKGAPRQEVLNPRAFNQAAPFKKFARNGKHIGSVRIETYRLSQPTGEILFRSMQGGSYTRSWRHLRAFTDENISEKSKKILDSGFIEGIVTMQNCSWDFSRQSLRAENAEAWSEVLAILEEWAQQADVAQHVSRCLAPKEEALERELVDDVAAYFQTLAEEYPAMLERALAVMPGQYSGGHTQIEDEVSSQVPGRSSPRRTGTGGSGRNGGGGTIARTRPTRERQGMQHIHACDETQGNPRYVSRTQTGLMICCGDFGTIDSYRWDFEQGILYINPHHPNFIKVKESEVKERMKAYFRGIAEWAIIALQNTEVQTNELESASVSQMERQYMEFLLVRVQRISKK